LLHNYYSITIIRDCKIYQYSLSIHLQKIHKHRHHRDDGAHKTIRMKMSDAKRNTRILKLLPAVKVSLEILYFLNINIIYCHSMTSHNYYDTKIQNIWPKIFLRWLRIVHTQYNISRWV